MTRMRSIVFGWMAIGALAAFAAGCSGSDETTSGDSGPSSAGATGTTEGGVSASSGGASSGTAAGSGAGSSGSGRGVGSSTDAGSGSGSGSGSQTAADAGAMTAPDAAASTDATAAIPESGATADSGTSGGDGGLCDNAAQWLVPMNQARAALGVGEPPLICDPIAAEVALNYAKKCNYAHNMNRQSDYAALGGTATVGENIAAGTPTETVAAAVSSWNSEVQYYTHSTNTCAAGQMCGHYTQIVWKTTTAVGCAHVSCTTNSPFGTGRSSQWDFSVCDYTPAGNFIGQPPY